MAKDKVVAPVVTKRVKNGQDAFIDSVLKHKSNRKAIAAELGISENSVTVRMSQYRRKGINLPKAERTGGGVKLDVAAANARIEQFLTTADKAE